MHPDTERLIELASQSLVTDPATQLAAARVLQQHFEARPDIPVAAVADASESFARADLRPRRMRWRTVLYLTTLVVSLPLLVPSVWQLVRFAGIHRLSDPLAASNSRLPDISGALNPQEKLLLMGDVNAASRAARWQPLWASAPDNPAYLSEYASAYFHDHHQLPPEILAAAERLDPANGWLPVLAAAESAEGAVTRVPLTFEERKAGKPPILKINDASRLEKSLAMIHQVAAKPGFTTYQTELLRQRIPLLPRRTDYVSQVQAMVYVACLSTEIINLIKLGNVLGAGAHQCAERHDVAGFRQLTDDWRKLVQATSRGSDTLIELMVAKAFFTSPLVHFRDAAQSLGLDQEARHFANLQEGVKAEKEAREHNPRTAAMQALVAPHGSVYAGMGLPAMLDKVANPPAITDADLRPGRYAEYALFGRVGSFMGWAMLGICAAGAGLSRYRQIPTIRCLSARMLDLLRPSDWVWILLGGVILPLIVFGIITRLTPLSAREWSLRWTAFIQPSCQFGSLLVWMIIQPLVITRWRLGLRGDVMGLGSRRPWMGWLAAGAAALAIPGYGAMMIGRDRLFLNLASILLALAVLWLLVGLGCSLFGRTGQALRRATLARMVLPAWIFGMLVFAILVPLHDAEERHWIQQDRLLEIAADAPALSRYEYALSQVFRTELLELIDQRTGK